MLRKLCKTNVRLSRRPILWSGQKVKLKGIVFCGRTLLELMIENPSVAKQLTAISENNIGGFHDFLFWIFV